MKKLSFISLLWLLFLLSITPLFAQEPDRPSFDEINEVAVHLNCPTCQNLNLADCRTQTCAQWRDQIGDMLAEGKTPQEVIDWYTVNYGAEVLQEPPAKGIGLFVWVLPFIALGIGAVVYVFIVKQWSAKKAAPVAVTSFSAEAMAKPAGAEADEDYLKRVEQELKNL